MILNSVNLWGLKTLYKIILYFSVIFLIYSVARLFYYFIPFAIGITSNKMYAQKIFVAIRKSDLFFSGVTLFILILVFGVLRIDEVKVFFILFSIFTYFVGNCFKNLNRNYL